ncbi:DEAD/DEAH box helicase [Novymonas esmeraldas]|uniref:RNA helicase n=1 Tax=Novymonas esmeraldas TaxID=1808958 RepID=A0AAW0EU82_9TRYP
MRLCAHRCRYAVGRGARRATSGGAHAEQRRCFVDAPIAEEAVVSGMTVPTAAAAAAVVGEPAPGDVGASYAYPLDVGRASFKLYGESATFANEDANRLFSSARVHSYDPAVLFNDLRLQEVHHELLQPAAGLGATGASDASLATTDHDAALQSAEEEENDAVMRSSRNKQGAAGAAAMAAAMLDSRRAADGIAMVPNHPLPVVFPRPDGLPPPLRFIKKFGPGGARQARTGKRTRQAKQASTDEAEATMHGEVMECDRRVESHSLQHSIAWRVQLLDEHRKPVPVKTFQHFRETSDVLPRRVMQGLSESGFTRPTLLQAAAIPQLMRGRDVVGVAPDGSGTTVAYAVPSMAVLVKVKAEEAAAAEQEMAARAREEDGAGGSPLDDARGTSAAAAAEVVEVVEVVACPIVVVLCTTRQTVLRTAAMYSSLAGEDFRLVAAYRSADSDEEAEQRAVMRRKRGCDVLVATPARLTTLVRDGVVSLHRTHVLAVDKTNHLLAADPTPDGRSTLQHVEDVMRAVRDNDVAHQLSLWCDEVGPSIEALVRKYMSPLTVTVMVTREEQTNVNVRQILYPLPSRDDRLKAIQQLYDQRTILKRDQVVVYCAYRETAEDVTRELTRMLSAPSSMVRCVHSGLRSRKRLELLKAFQHGDIRILVGTDVATKQLDVEELEHVIHYDLPAFTEVYMQRVHQVGRSGRQGTSHTFLTPGDARVPTIARFVEKQTGHAVNDVIRSMIADVEAAGGGEDSWDTPVLRKHNHTMANTKWRVRGRREMRQQVESLSGVVSESDKRPVGQTT